MTLEQRLQHFRTLAQRKTRWLHTGPGLWRTLKQMPSVYPMAYIPAKPSRLKLPRRIYPIAAFIVTAIALGATFVPPSSKVYWTATIGSIIALGLMSLTYFRNYFVSVRVSGAIARERQQSSYDVISLTPLGDMGTTLLIGNAVLSKNRKHTIATTARRAGKPPLPLWLMIILIYVALGTVLFFGDYEYRVQRYPTAFIAWLVTLVENVAYFSAFIQEIEFTPSIGSIVGMLIPHFVRRVSSAQAASILLFFAIQIANVFLIMVGCFVLLPLIYDKLTFSGWIADIILFVLRYIVYLLVRAGTIQLLWRILTKRLRTKQAEVDLALRLPITLLGIKPS